MLKIPLSFLLLLLIPASGDCQEIANKESIPELYEEARKLAYETKFKEALPLSLKGLKNSIELANDTLIYEGHNLVGYSYYGQGFNRLALKNYNSAYEIALSKGDRRRQFESIWFLSALYGRNEEYLKAIEYNQLAIAYTQENDKPTLAAQLRSNLGMLYLEIGKLDSANIQLKKAAKGLLKSNDSVNYASVLINQMEIANKLNQLDSANFYYQKVLNLQFPLLSYQRAAVNRNRAQTLFQKKDYHKALKVLDTTMLEDRNFYYCQNYFQLKSNILSELGEDKKASRSSTMAKFYLDSVQFEKKDIALAEIESERDRLEVKIIADNQNDQIQILNNETKEKKLYLVVIISVFMATVTLAIIVVKKLRERYWKNRLTLERSRSRASALRSKVTKKNQELTEFTLSDIKKKKNLLHLIDSLKDESLSSKARKIYAMNDDWAEFRNRFLAVKPSFFERLTGAYPALTEKELNLLALVGLRLTSKDIAAVLNISKESVEKARYRIRKKMSLSNGESLFQSISPFLS